jgi:hypothetical protein
LGPTKRKRPDLGLYGKYKNLLFSKLDSINQTKHSNTNMLAIILALAGSSLIILLVFKRLASRSASNCALETVTTFSILKNKGQLRTYLNNRILGSKARFIKLGMPGVPTIVIKNPEDAKARLIVH